jgi:hypothetical protein
VGRNVNEEMNETRRGKKLTGRKTHADKYTEFNKA